MKINIEINLDSNETNNSAITTILNSVKNIALTLTQLTNISTYLDLIKNLSNTENIITHSKEIIHAYNYGSDTDYYYWIIIDVNYSFFDVYIPKNKYDLQNCNSLTHYEKIIARQLYDNV